MPEYLAPGVFVEEVSFRSKSIEGVGTSVAGLIGPTRTGPLRGRPELLTSFADFVRIYGDAKDLTFGSSTVLNHTAIAAKAFFDGGGSKLYVARTVGNVNATNANGNGSSATFATISDSSNDISFKSRHPGAAGNVTLELQWQDSENLLKSEITSTPKEGEVVFLQATGLTTDVRTSGITARAPTAAFPISFSGLVRRNGDDYEIVDNQCVIDTDNDSDLSGANLRLSTSTDATDEGMLIGTGLANNDSTTVTFTRVYAKAPTSGALEDGNAAVLALSGETNLSDYTGEAHWGTLTTLRGTLNKEGTTINFSAALNDGIASAFDMPLAALAATPSSAQAIMVQRNFNIDVRKGGANGEMIYSYGNINTAPSGAGSLAAVMPADFDKRFDDLTSPVSCTVTASNGDEVLTALYDLFDDAAMSPAPGSLAAPRYLITLEGGGDGTAPVAIDYGGQIDEVDGNTGFAAFENIEDIAIVMAPAAVIANEITHQAIIVEMQKHCLKMRYRVGIADARKDMSLSEVRSFRSNLGSDSRLALYYPWVVTADPTGQRETITVPPAGFIAGVYARTDVDRGVHKAPANMPVIGALRFAQDINKFHQEMLNPDGVNCLRSFPGSGHRVWGGRTLSTDPEWKYVNVRRYFLYLERSIEKSTQWVVFEPNGERLWANVQSTIEGFLYNEWFNGRLLGGSPKEAYFVRCDRSTMTQNDIDNGRLVCEIGVAPLRPAEFVIFRIGQKTADA